MSDRFDPYHTWLGIPASEQPPHYYRLLGIALFESDAEVIQNACDQRMTHLKAFATGSRAVLSERLLNEVSRAAVCLLNSGKKRAYDNALRAKLAPERSSAQPARPHVTPLPDQPGPVPVGRSATPQPSPPLDFSALPTAGEAITRRLHAHRRRTNVLFLVVALLLLVVMGLAASCFVLWLVDPTHPLITFVERFAHRSDAAPVATTPAPATSPNSTTPSVRPTTATAPTTADAPTPAAPAPAVDNRPDVSQPPGTAEPPANITETQLADAADPTPPDAEVMEAAEPAEEEQQLAHEWTTVEVPVDLSDATCYRAMPDIVGQPGAEVQLQRISGVSARYELTPDDGVIHPGQRLDIVFAQHGRVTLRLELDTNAGKTRLKISPLIDTGTGTAIHFTRRWMAEEVDKSSQLVEGLQQSLMAAEQEYVVVDTWLNAPGPKPLELRGQRRQRLAYLGGAIPVMQQNLREARSRATAIERLATLADELQRNARLRIIVRIPDDDTEPPPSVRARGQSDPAAPQPRVLPDVTWLQR